MLSENRIKAHELFKQGYSKSEIGRQLNVSRERVRQYLVTTTTKGWKSQERICSYCDKKFLPSYEYQSTCCNRSVEPQNCEVCGDLVHNTGSKAASLRVITCKKLECRNERIKRVRAMTRTVDTICYSCGAHTKTWQYILNQHGRARCAECLENKYSGRCIACGKLITYSSKNRTCRTHIKFGKEAAYSESTK